MVQYLQLIFGFLLVFLFFLLEDQVGFHEKKALITGITGQDGSYLAEFLLSKNYVVHGIKRKSSSLNTSELIIFMRSHEKRKIFLHYGDMTDSSSLNNIINLCLPDEIYNLAAQSHVGVSFEQPEYTANVDALGT